MRPSDPSHWIPFLWPASWTRPSIIDLLQATPWNCVVVPPGAPLAVELERAGLAVQPETIVSREHGKMDWTDPGPVLAVRGCVWPRVAQRAGNDSNEAGPTGLPWIDANGWFIQLARARWPEKPVWIQASPPKGEVLRPSSYAVAVADAEAYGARWLATLDPTLAEGVAAGNGEARRSWQALIAALHFFQRHSDPLPPYGLVAGLSDFSSGNEAVSHEFLNLIAREYVPVHVLWKLHTAPAVPPGVRMVVYLDPEPVPDSWRPVLAGFLREGGIVVAGPRAMPAAKSPAQPLDPLGYDQYAAGKGRLVVARAHFEDPWRLAADARLLMGRRFDLLRFANAGSCNVVFSASRDGRRAQLRMVNYAGRPALSPVTATLLHRYRIARFHSPERPGATEDLPVYREAGRTVLHLPEFAVYAEMNLEM